MLALANILFRIQTSIGWCLILYYGRMLLVFCLLLLRIFRLLERETVDKINNRAYYIAFKHRGIMYEKFLPVVQTMIDSVQLDTSDMSSIGDLDSTTTLGNDSSITDSMLLDDAIPFLDVHKKDKV